jgi:hypothetical protein
MLQNAWLKANSYIRGRGVGSASTRNPAVALSEETHRRVGEAQRSIGLNDPSKLAKMTAQQNIELNAQAMRLAGVPEHVITELQKGALSHAEQLGPVPATQ